MAVLSNERLARRLVRERSMDLCELCGRPGNDWAHRVARSRGGLWIASNGVRLCGSGTTGCDGWTTSNLTLAEAGGWRIADGRHPEEVPVWLRHPQFGAGWWLLLDDGCVAFADDAPEPVLPPWAAAGYAVTMSGYAVSGGLRRRRAART